MRGGLRGETRNGLCSCLNQPNAVCSSQHVALLCLGAPLPTSLAHKITNAACCDFDPSPSTLAPSQPCRWVLVGGYLVNPNSIPVWLRWVRSLSPMSFAFEVLAANEMSGQYYNLDVKGFAQVDGIEGDIFLRTLGLEPSEAARSAGVLAAFYAGSVALAFAVTAAALRRRGGGGVSGAAGAAQVAVEAEGLSVGGLVAALPATQTSGSCVSQLPLKRRV